MKTTNVYLNRLLILARHIGKQHLQEVLFKKAKKYSSSKAGSGIEHFAWALDKLPHIDPKQWLIDDKGFPYLPSAPGLNALTCAGIYFNLTADELFHLFVPDHQDSLYLGKSLDDYATPDQLANNIYQFILYKENEPSENYFPVRIKNNREKKVIKKLKYKNAA